ncbi:unnamed protein product [Blepharisma stoltei]|uniref:Protein-tyrosine-phosphatase n=1 Tax=Blepharisma stoltei TaxID=1481888 RepID=A0AAU9K4U9_9CILI|nr:unnamed protein product [Blepharisma stoltei]
MYCIDKIDDGIFLGNEAVALRQEILKENGITHIIIAAKELEPHFEGTFVYKKIDAYDQSSSDITKFFEECNNFIDEALANDGRVLIHCYQGVSRSCAVAAAYLISKRGYSCKLALDYIKKKHYECCPNNGFKEQLEAYYRSLQKMKSNGEEVKSSRCHCLIF